MAIVSRDTDVKPYIGITDTSRDAVLDTYIAAATQLAVNAFGPVESTSYDEWHDGGCTTVVVDHPPVLTVTAVTEFRGTVAYTLTAIPLDGTTQSPWSYTVDKTTG